MGGVRVALRSGGRKGRVRKGLSGSAVAAAAMAALTASQSPEVIAGQPDDVRRKVLWDNAAALYQVGAPVTA